MIKVRLELELHGVGEGEDHQGLIAAALAKHAAHLRKYPFEPTGTDLVTRGQLAYQFEVLPDED